MEDYLMIETPLEITGGLPYNRRIRVKNAALTWPTEDDFEVRSEIRVGPSSDSRLKASLVEYITPSVEDDDILLDLNLTGSVTRTLPGGYYDIIVSDAGSMDNRAIRVLGGKLTIKPLVTGA
jgi:hypothetical protein